MVKYVKGPLISPQAGELIRYIDFELTRVQDAFEGLEFNIATAEMRHTEPERPREGMIVFADGENWNPESGRGLYMYSSADAAWVRIDNAPGRHSRLKWYYALD